MGEGVLGLPEMYMWKLYSASIRKRRHWSLERMEKWLQGKGLEVFDVEKDERGEYFIVGTMNKTLADAIQKHVDRISP